MNLGRSNVGPNEVRRETQAYAAGGLRFAFLVSPLRIEIISVGPCTVYGVA